MITLSIYTIIIYGIATLARHQTLKKEDYLLGGRNMSGFVTALSAGASDMSSWLLMALPGLIYTKGLSAIWLPLSLTLGSYLNWHIVARRLRKDSEQYGNALTIPAYLGNRFAQLKKPITLLSSFILLIFFIFYAVAGFVSAGKMTQLTFGISYDKSVWLSGIFIVLYTAIGGFLAVSWVDVFQGLLMFFALLIVPTFVYSQLPSGSASMQHIIERVPDYWSITKGTSLLSIISLFAWGLGYVGQPHIISRFMAIKKVEELPLARNICTGWMGNSMIFAVGVGLVGALHYYSPSLQDPEMVFLLLSKKFFPEWGYAILLCAVLSSIMSTVSALVLLSATTLVEDLYGIWGNQSKKVPIAWYQVSVIAVSCIAMAIAARPGATVMESVAFPWCGLGASFGPVIVASLYSKRLTPLAAIAGIITGATTVCLWKLGKWIGIKLLNHPQLEAGFSLLPAFILSGVMMVIVTYFESKRSNYITKN